MSTTTTVQVSFAGSSKKRNDAEVIKDPCGCITAMNEALKIKGQMLRVATAVKTGRQFFRIECMTLDGMSRRASSFTLTPSFCPFCGADIR